MRTPDTASCPSLESDRLAFDQWRRSRVGRSHTPAPLRRQAAALLSRHRASHICSALKINDQALKRWARAALPVSQVSVMEQGTSFIELPALSYSQVSDSSRASVDQLRLSIELGAGVSLAVHGQFTLEEIVRAVRHGSGAEAEA